MTQKLKILPSKPRSIYITLANNVYSCSSKFDLKVVASIHPTLRWYPRLKTLKLHHGQPKRRNLLLSGNFLFFLEICQPWNAMENESVRVNSRATRVLKDKDQAEHVRISTYPHELPGQRLLDSTSQGSNTELSEHARQERHTPRKESACPTLEG